MKSRLMAAMLFVGIAGCAHEGRYTWVDRFEEHENTAQSTYSLAAGDVISVRVLNHDEMSVARARVRTDGKVSLPFLNDVEVSGNTPNEVGKNLQAKLKDYVANPVVTVTLEEMRPFSVSVMGEVSRPGVYALEPGAGVLQALASAGGLNTYAHDDGVYVLRRDGKGEPQRIRFDYEQLSRAEGKAATFRLRSSDVVVVE